MRDEVGRSGFLITKYIYGEGKRYHLKNVSTHYALWPHCPPENNCDITDEPQQQITQHNTEIFIS